VVHIAENIGVMEILIILVTAGIVIAPVLFVVWAIANLRKRT